MDNPEISPDQQELLSKAKRCEWAGIACLFATPIFIVASSFYGLNSENLGRQLWLAPKAVEGMALIFIASWIFACFGFLCRGGEYKLRSMAQNEAQKAALGPLVRARRWQVVLWMLAIAMNAAVQPLAGWAKQGHISQVLTMFGISVLILLPYAIMSSIGRRAMRVWDAASSEGEVSNFATQCHTRRVASSRRCV